jgi:hypothetical protein
MEAYQLSARILYQVFNKHEERKAYPLTSAITTAAKHSFAFGVNG